jgi:hypothetical protein
MRLSNFENRAEEDIWAQKRQRVTGGQGQVNSEKKHPLNGNELLVTSRCISNNIIERNLKNLK